MKLWTKFKALFSRRRLEREMTDEIRAHLDTLTARNAANGMPPEEARYAALRTFGGVEQIKEQARDERRLPWLENLVKDFSYGLRRLRKSPGFTVIVVVTLALGIGATTAIFTVVNSVVLEPLPYRDSGRLMALREMPQDAKPWSYPGARRTTAEAWQRQSMVLDSLATVTFWPRTVTDMGEPVRLYAWKVSTNYFATLGVAAVRGRTFRPDEGMAGKDHVLVISHRLWLSRFNGRDDAIGKQVRIDEENYTIIGVLPENFMPEPVTDPAFFAPQPVPIDDANGPARYIHVVGRLKPGVSVTQVQDELAAISARVAQESSQTDTPWNAVVTPLLESKIRDVKPFLLLLLGASGFLLLISCVNVANLMLARSSARAGEIALRIALGAGRARIMDQLLCESLLLSLAGSALGVGIAYAGLQQLLDNAPLSLPRATEIALDGRVLIFCCLTAVLTALIFGLFPAWQASQVKPQLALRERGRGTSAGGRALRLRNGLVAFEVALALVLLMGAGLMIRSFLKLQQVPLGFSPHTSYLAKNILPPSRYPTPASQTAFVNRAQEKLSAVPGVHSVVFSSYFPTFGGYNQNYRIDSRPELTARNLPPAGCFITTPNFFRALDVRLRQGRLLETRDDATAPNVVVVSQGFADKYFPGQSPLGQRITIEGNAPVSREIVGVVANVHDMGPLDERPFQLYVPFAQAPIATPCLLIRVDRPVAGLERSLRQALDLVDPEMPLTIVMHRDLNAFLNETIAPQRYALFVFTAFAGVALLLSALGIYGVVAYSVAQRTQEIGIRMALGAQARDILRLIFTQTGRVVLVGMIVGLLGAVGGARWLGGLLYGVGEHDPLAFAAVPVFLGAIALLACWLPARRAVKINPIVALRSE